MIGSVIEAQIISTLEQISNGEPVIVEDEWVEQAGEQFKDALRKQLTPRDRDFRLRMSNVGRPRCQLQMEASGAKREKMPYNHVVRMLIGDSVEVALRLIMKIAQIDVTSDGDRVHLDVSNTTIKGDSDIDVSGYVYDIKSASPWSYANKFKAGYEALASEDSFGYIGQLVGYADAQGKDIGGWIAINKSTGEVCVTDATPTDTDLKIIRAERKRTVNMMERDEPFRRCFTDVEETFRGKLTGARKLNKSCEFCSYKQDCWPGVQYLPSPASQAKSPPHNWYTAYPEKTE